MMALAANLRYRVGQPTDGSMTKEIAFPYLRFLKIKWFNQNCGQWKEVNELAMTVWTVEQLNIDQHINMALLWDKENNLMHN